MAVPSGLQIKRAITDLFYLYVDDGTDSITYPNYKRLLSAFCLKDKLSHFVSVQLQKFSCSTHHLWFTDRR